MMLVLVNVFLIFAAGVVSEEAVYNVDVPGDLGQNESTLVTAINETEAEDFMKRVFDHSIASYLENLYGGISAEIINNNFTYDKDGHPMIAVNQAQTLLMSALLTEHDESFHADWPGQSTVIPEKNLSEEPIEKEDNSKFAEDGHVLASTIDDSLIGHVHPDDEEDLEQMIEQPPKLKRVRRAFMFRDDDGQPTTWPRGIIPYVFDSNIWWEAKDAAIESMNFIMNAVPCIKFEPANRNSINYVLITSSGNGCYAHIGMGQGENAFNLGDGCGFNVAVHEWGHILGALHTQTRPDRDDFVEVNWYNIEDSMMGNFKKSYNNILNDDSEYDYDSVMHYPTHGFAKNHNYATIRVKYPYTFDLPQYGHRYGLSDQDEESLRLWYGCPNAPGFVDLQSNSAFLNEEDDEGCIVGNWERKWGPCTRGLKVKKRNLLSGNCPPDSLQKTKRCRGGKWRSKRGAESGSEESNDTAEAVEDEDRAEVSMSRLLEVNIGEPIVLIVSNPKNFSVEWYHVVDGQNVKIENDSEVYTITRTKVGNERLVIEKSGLEDDGHVFFVKISMSHSVLRVSWDISVSSVEPEDQTLLEEANETEEYSVIPSE